MIDAIIDTLIPSVRTITLVEQGVCMRCHSRFIFIKVTLISVFVIFNKSKRQCLDAVSQISTWQAQRMRWSWIYCGVMALWTELETSKLFFGRFKHLVKLIFIHNHIELILQVLLKLFHDIYLLPNFFHLISISCFLKVVLVVGPGHLTKVTTCSIVLSLDVFLVAPSAEIVAILLRFMCL